MMKRLLFLVLIAISGPARAGDLTLVQTIPLENVDGRIDHFALDSGRHRLFMAALGNDTVEVIDLSSQKRERTLTGFGEPQGIAIGVAVNRMAIANGNLAHNLLCSLTVHSSWSAALTALETPH